MYQEMLDSLKTSLISLQVVRGRNNLPYFHCLVQVFMIRVHALCNQSPDVGTNSSSDHRTSNSSSANDIQCVSPTSNENSFDEAPRIMFNSN
jgi:hypothetical protein